MIHSDFRNRPQTDCNPSNGLIETMLYQLLHQLLSSSIFHVLLSTLTDVFQQVREIRTIYFYIFYANECNDLY